MKLEWILTIITTWISLTYESAIVSKSMNSSQSSKFPVIELMSSLTFNSFKEDLAGDHDATPSTNLPLIPANFTSLNQLLNSTPLRPPIQTRSLKVNNGHKSRNLNNPRPIKLTAIEEENLKLAQMTDTDLSCYIAPPNDTIVDMNLLMGFWNMVRTVKSADGTDERYTCEQVIYTRTGPNTFNKVADVHFRHKWITIEGNGTFIKPGIIILDWKVLSQPSAPNRLVYTILGTDYKQFVVGYNCRTGNNKPEIVLQTRQKRVPMKYLHKAYDIIRSNGLPLDYMDCSDGFGPQINVQPAGATTQAPSPTTSPHSLPLSTQNSTPPLPSLFVITTLSLNNSHSLMPTPSALPILQPFQTMSSLKFQPIPLPPPSIALSKPGSLQTDLKMGSTTPEQPISKSSMHSPPIPSSFDKPPSMSMSKHVPLKTDVLMNSTEHSTTLQQPFSKFPDSLPDTISITFD